MSDKVMDIIKRLNNDEMAVDAIDDAIAEITALRAALDQERAKVRQLRDVIEASGEWLPNSRGKLIFQFGGGWIANDETLALLSGRGEGGG